MNPTHILLSGATGTLGLELLPRLLRQNPRPDVTLLLRAESRVACRRRLSAVKRYVRTYWPELDLNRLGAVRGDVSLPRLGLQDHQYRDLQNHVSHVVHAAALTKFNPPTRLAWRTNVLGTERILQFAHGGARLKRLAFVSTAYVAGDRSGSVTESELDCGQGFLNTYQRSKYEAESLVRSWMPRLPIIVLRPSIIVGDSTDGHISSLDNIYYPLEMIATGTVREIPAPGSTRLDLVPIDYVVSAMVQLLASPDSPGLTFHLTAGAGNTVTARTLVETAVRLAGRRPDLPPRFAEDLATRTAGPSNPQGEESAWPHRDASRQDPASNCMESESLPPCSSTPSRSHTDSPAWICRAFRSG
jgi:thioester reductase-like protein